MNERIGLFIQLSANLVDSQSGALLFPAFTTVQAGQLRVTVLALTDPQARVPSGCRLRPWQEVLPQLVQKLRPEAHLLVLLSNQPFTENKKIATACPGLDLIFQAGYTMGNLPPTQVGHALIYDSHPIHHLLMGGEGHRRPVRADDEVHVRRRGPAPRHGGGEPGWMVIIRPRSKRRIWL